MVVATAAASGSPTTAVLPPPNDVVAGLTAVPEVASNFSTVLFHSLVLKIKHKYGKTSVLHSYVLPI